MFERFTEIICKSTHYCLMPFAYPGQFFTLSRLMLTNRPLVRELVQLTEHRKWFETVGFRTIIDVGGYIGAFSLAVHTMLPGARIYAFEPLPDNFKQLAQNLSKVGNFRAFNTAVGEQQGEIDFWQNEFAASSSALPMEELHKKTFPHTNQSTKVTVPVARLDDYLPEMELAAPILLKLDVQGYEEKALLGATELLKQVDYVLTEVSHQPLYEGQTTFDSLYALMKNQGFEFAGGFESLISPKDGSILQSDALFKRSL